jgi:hypothetical protein
MSKLDAASKTSPSLQAELDEQFTKMAPIIDAINKGMAATTPAALADRADALRRERPARNSNSYGNWRVDALLAGQTSIDSTWTETDFLELAMAALDQGGVSAMTQATIAKLVSDAALKGAR